MSPLSKVLFFCVLLGSNDIHLHDCIDKHFLSSSESLSSNTSEGQLACPDEVVQFTCVNTETVAVRWLAESPTTSYVVQNDDLFFLFTEEVGTMKTKDNFTATLTSNTAGTVDHDLTSTLNVPVSDVDNGTVVTCDGRVDHMATLYIASESGYTVLATTTTHTHTVLYTTHY